MKWVERGKSRPATTRALPSTSFLHHTLPSSSSAAATPPAGPKGYRNSSNAPLLLGPSHCPQCLCSPCVIEQPPDFLAGSAGPHPANDYKRHRLYKMFWRLLKDLGVWKTEEYLMRKEGRTRRADRREIMPGCIIKVRSSS